MAAKGRKQSKRVVQKVVEPEPEPEPESSDEDEVDLETMEKMLDSDSEGTSEEDVADDQEEEVDQEEEASSEGDVEDEESESESDAEMKSSEDEEEDDEEEDVAIGGDEKVNIDLRNLVAFNTHQVNHNELFKNQSMVDSEDPTTILVDGMKIANEEHLLEKACEGCSQLLVGLWKLDTEKTDVGPMAILPSYFETKTPRALVSLSIYIRDKKKCLLCVVSNSTCYLSEPNKNSHLLLQRLTQNGKSLPKIEALEPKKSAPGRYGTNKKENGDTELDSKRLRLPMIQCLGQLWK